VIKFTDGSSRVVQGFSLRQARALEKLLHRAATDEYAGTNPETIIVYEVEVRATTYGTAWVTIRPDIPSLPPGNALRTMTMIETWHVHVGKRGKLEAWMYPRSLEQFAGGEWCGVHVRRAAKKETR
jgi:hypothetical protein